MPVMRSIPFVILFGLVPCWLLAASAHGAYLELGPMVGHTGPKEVKIWAKASGPAELSVRIGRNEDLSDSRVVAGPQLRASADYMGTVSITGLKPDQRYYYAVRLDNQPTMLRPLPSIRTAPKSGEETRLRFAFVSCLGRNGYDAAAAWGDMAARTSLDMLLLLGDNHYADSTAPAKQRDAYYDHRSVAGYQKITRHTPTYAIWDDHDYGPNDSNRTADGKEKSLKTFKEFWANPGYGTRGNPGVYFKFVHGDIEFFMLDDRYYRFPNKAPNDDSKTMLGERQLDWLKRGLRDSEAAIKFVASGSEWQTHGHLDSWTSFDRERQEIWDFIRDNDIQGVIFLSGDRHFTGAYQIQDRFIEVTSGPLGSRNFPTENLPEMFINYGSGKMYSVFDVDTRADEPMVTLEIYRAAEGLLEKREFTWDEINGRTNIPELPQPE